MSQQHKNKKIKILYWIIDILKLGKCQLNEAPKVRTRSAIKHYLAITINLLPKEQVIC